MNNHEINDIEHAIQDRGLTAPRITPSQIKDLMDRISHDYFVQGTSTFCHTFLDGKFLLATGHSACVSPENFDRAIGRSIAFRDAMAQSEKKLWELEGYALYKKLAEGGAAMSPHEQRVIDERAELDAKLEKLVPFLSSDICHSLPFDERGRLKRQAVVMMEYSKILSERIAAFA